MEKPKLIRRISEKRLSEPRSSFEESWKGHEEIKRKIEKRKSQTDIEVDNEK